MEKTSLGDFVEESGDDGGSAEPADAGAEAADDPAATVEPPRPTAVWTPAGGDCARCGERARRRWRGDDALVCADCAEW